MRMTFSPSVPYFRYTRRTLPGSPGLAPSLNSGPSYLPTWKSRMNPSSFRTWAMLALSLVAFISAAGRSIEFALRIRVSMSAIGSVIMAVRPLPAGLADARDHPVGRQGAETDAADAELLVHGPRPAADLAPGPDLHQVARAQDLGLVPLRFRLAHLGLVGVDPLQVPLVAGFF